MTKYFAAILLAVSACSTDYVPPSAAPPAPDAPIGEQGSQTIAFFAKNEAADVAAQCSVGGPAVNFSFTTPATIAIPFDGDRAMSTVIECKYNGQTLSTQTPPNLQTDIIQVDFSSSRAEFWFKRNNGGVLYYTRGDLVITVSGSPGP